jgi:hypothetical protein
MHTIKPLFPRIFCVLFVVFVFMTSPVSSQKAPVGFVSLFNGTDFTGWGGNLDFFRVEEGAIVAGTLEREIPHNEFLCTDKRYSDFELRLEVRTSDERVNAGIQIRSDRAPNDPEVIGYQADVGIEPERNIWGGLYDEARRREMLALADQDALAKVYKPGEWVDYRIRAEGRRIQIWINGLRTVDYTEADDAIPGTGIIGLQIHSGGPGEALYRNIFIKELDQPRK